MKITVFGLWHLGCVTAACLAKAGHKVIGLDPDKKNISQLVRGKAPLFEPGLDDLLAQGIKDNKLSFITDAEAALKDAGLLWVTFDTPVDEQDNADADFVVNKVKACFPYLKNGMLVVISSQLPAGSTASLDQAYKKAYPNQQVDFCCSPENLRLGSAIKVFCQPDRVVAGVPDERAKKIFAEALAPITEQVEWMSVASAEMTKHAINAFLATSVVFANELASLCEAVGADAKEVERGLKTDQRIGPKAYLGAGNAFSGGTLARDLAYLEAMNQKFKANAGFFHSVFESNLQHKERIKAKAEKLLGGLKNKRVTILGLTYKAGTSALRRSWPLELAQWFHQKGAQVKAFDPVVKELPAEASFITLSPELSKAMTECDLAVVASEWPELRDFSLADLAKKLAPPILLDPAGFFAKQSIPQNLIYARVGKPVQRGK